MDAESSMEFQFYSSEDTISNKVLFFTPVYHRIHFTNMRQLCLYPFAVVFSFAFSCGSSVEGMVGDDPACGWKDLQLAPLLQGCVSRFSLTCFVYEIDRPATGMPANDHNLKHTMIAVEN
jgi:hypothetical protein